MFKQLLSRREIFCLKAWSANKKLSAVSHSTRDSSSSFQTLSDAFALKQAGELTSGEVLLASDVCIEVATQTLAAL